MTFLCFLPSRGALLPCAATLTCLLISACAPNDPEIVAHGDAGDAALPETDSQAQQPDSGVPADDGGNPCAAQSARISAFIESHRTCSVDSDCAIIGGCSASFGFAAVSASAREEGQRLPVDPRCTANDGPLYAALCEQGSCVARRTGASCGGVESSCQEGYERYTTGCGGEERCRKRCSGAADTSCSAGFSCQQAQVAPAVGACTVPLERWLCLPSPACDVLLHLESAPPSTFGSSARRRTLFGTSPVAFELAAENLRSAPKTFTYQRPCPGGPVLSGLGNYDAWDNCLAGACPSNPPTEVTLVAGARVSLGRATVTRDGNTCNPSGLPKGEYKVSFALDGVQGVTVCGPEAYELSSQLDGLPASPAP